MLREAEAEPPRWALRSRSAPFHPVPSRTGPSVVPFGEASCRSTWTSSEPRRSPQSARGPRRTACSTPSGWGPARRLPTTSSSTPPRTRPTGRSGCCPPSPPSWVPRTRDRSKIGDFDPAMLLHGEQRHRALRTDPAGGSVRTTSTVTGIYDKGSGALVVVESTSVDAGTGEPRWRTTNALFIRGEGGFGGERGPAAAASPIPDGPPDQVVECATRPDQALLYRLSGDRNPLHSDPAFARRAGFERPILHGLCTYGFTGRALLHGCAAPIPAGSCPCRAASHARPTRGTP